MKNSKKILTTVIVLVVIAIIVLCVYFYKVGGQVASYQNTLLGYEVSIPTGWHIDVDMSKRMDKILFLTDLEKSAGCDISAMADSGVDQNALVQQQNTCLKASGKLASIDATFKNYTDSWTPANSENVFLTRLSSSDLNNAVADIVSMRETLPKGSFIIIRPFDSVLSFKTATSSRSGLKTSFYSVNGISSYLTDLRATKLDNGNAGMSLDIPFSSDKRWYMGGQIQSIIFDSTAVIGSQDETTFFDTIQTFKVKK